MLLRRWGEMNPPCQFSLDRGGQILGDGKLRQQSATPAVSRHVADAGGPRRCDGPEAQRHAGHGDRAGAGLQEAGDHIADLLLARAAQAGEAEAFADGQSEADVAEGAV